MRVTTTPSVIRAKGIATTASPHEPWDPGARWRRWHDLRREFGAARQVLRNACAKRDSGAELLERSPAGRMLRSSFRTARRIRSSAARRRASSRRRWSPRVTASSWRS